MGTIATSTLFLVTILALVVYLAVTRKDQTVTGGGRNVAVRASRRVRT